MSMLVSSMTPTIIVSDEYSVDFSLQGTQVSQELTSYYLELIQYMIESV